MVTAPWNQDPFRDAQGNPRTLRGVAILSNAPTIAEMAGRIGFETVWIDVEHGTPSFTEIQALCMAAEAAGAVPTVRLPDHHRHHILRALEVGARIVVVPMVNDAEIARELVQWGKFAPLGQRGFNTRSRGLNYGLDGIARVRETFANANETTHLIAQIETAEAAANLDEICAVPGISGILVGPGDLSASLGKPGAFTDPELLTLVADLIRRTRAHGKHAGIMTFPGPLLDTAIAAGADLLFFGGDFNDLARTWRGMLETAAGPR